MARRFSAVYLVFLVIFACNIALWFQLRGERAAWLNVPPVPGEHGLSAFFMGDRQFAYRATGVMLQNLGDVGGRHVSLRDYNYGMLGKWFFLMDALDPRSDYMPLLASYYYGGTPKGEDLGPVIDYLSTIGERPEGENWRWMAQAVYLARFPMGDMERALHLAEKLAAMWQPGRPMWMKQMPVFVMNAQGDKKAAYDLMLAILKEEAETLPQGEVNFMVSYICDRLLEPSVAATHELCNPKD